MLYAWTSNTVLKPAFTDMAFCPHSTTDSWRYLCLIFQLYTLSLFLKEESWQLTQTIFALVGALALFYTIFACEHSSAHSPDQLTW